MNDNFEMLKVQVSGPKKVGEQTGVPGEKKPTTGPEIGAT